MNEAPGRTLWRDGRTYIFYSGYSYLGMSHVSGFTDLLKEGIDRYGALFPSSRVSNTSLDVYGHLEHYLSQLTGRADTVTYASGYLACQAIGDLLKGYGQILVAPGTHPALGLRTSDGGSGGGASNGGPGGADRSSGGDAGGRTDYDAWCLQVQAHCKTSPHDHFVLAANSVNPLTGVINDFTFLRELPGHKRFTLCIDDSHGIGWMGEHGEGISSVLMHLPNIEYIICYSLSKALHIQGGAVSCPSAWAERLRRSPFYTASTPMAPAFAHTLLQAGALYEVQRADLTHNVGMLRRLAKSCPALEPTAIPVFLLREPGVAAYLEERGIIISSFAYPDPAGPLINRLIVSALHKGEDLEALAEALQHQNRRAEM
jgi:8-amino-7-oxononanoate synthase